MTDPTPAPDGLRQQCADALEPAITAALNRLLRTKGYDPDDPSVDHARTDRETAEVVGAVIPAVMAVRDRELEGLRDERDLHLAAFWQAVKRRDRALAQSAIDRPAADFAEAALARVIALHQPRNHSGRIICGACSDYDPSSDATDSAPVPYPCPTIRALDSTAQPAEEDA